LANPIEHPIILIVDDDKRNLITLSMCLRSDYDLMTALNAQEAMDIIETKMPDLLLLDIMMPDVSGYTLCTRLKNDQRTKDIPVIFITAKDSTEDVIKGLELGADDYITKPFKPAEVLARVKSTLRVYSRYKGQNNMDLVDLPFIEDNIDITSLTEKEIEILNLIAKGYTNKEIADMLVVSEFTVKNHLKSIFKKLKVSSRTQVVLVSIKAGLVK
jgi:DNA-binding NarL/FixJ family response regulator